MSEDSAVKSIRYQAQHTAITGNERFECRISSTSISPATISEVIVIPRLHDTAGCETGCTTGLTTGCIV